MQRKKIEGARKFVRSLVLIGLLSISATKAFSNSVIGIDTQKPVLLEAESIVYDQKTGDMSAEGQVVLSQGTQFVQANRIQYIKSLDRVIATGEVSLLDQTGHLLLASYLVLEKEFREGFIEKAKLLMADGAHLVAGKVERLPGNRTVVKQVRYTPCKLCEADPSKPPLWSIKAERVEQNGTKQHLAYRDAVLEVRGVPVFYMPYLSHPDPSVRRKTGLLTPTTSLSRVYGFYVAAPVFIDLGPHQDMTVTPHLMTKQGAIAEIQGRKHFERGIFDLTLSGGHLQRLSGTSQFPIENGRVARWHAQGKGRFDINDHWRWGLDLERSSDSTYLKQFRFFKLENRNSLDSKLFAEGFYGRHYLGITSYAFQGLSEQYRKETIPYVFPSIDLSFQGEPEQTLGGSWYVDANSLSLYRRQGADVQRFVTQAGWRKVMISPMGDITTLTTNLRGDLYHVRRYDPNDPFYLKETPDLANSVNQWIGRALPQAGVDWRYPWYRALGNNILTIQPILGVVVAPNEGQKRQLPNEDSRMFDLDDSNLFSYNRFSGWDMLDAGSRFNYGFQTDFYNQMGGQTVLFLGKSYALNRHAILPEASGIMHHNSDYVGRIMIMPNDVVNIKYKFRLAHKSLRVRRGDLSLQLGPEALRLSTDYFYFDKNIGTGDIKNREQIRFELSSKFLEQWHLKMHTVRDLSQGGKSLEHGLSAEYHNECVVFTAGLYRSFYEDLDVRADKGIFFRVTLKNLGGF